MGIKGCWTCRERKLRCDLRRPTCGNCAKARQRCRGYGIQLSWPREGDERRSLVYHNTGTPGIASRQHRRGDISFLNTLSWDVSLSDALQGRSDLAHYLHTLKVPHLPHLPSSFLSGNNATLLDFFNQSRSRILAPIVDEALAHFILSVALFNSSSPSNLVLEGILAIASLQLQGPSKSLSRQSRLISMLRENIIKNDRQNILQNLIATMLLYQYEVFATTSPEKRWSFYLCGAKKIIYASSTTVKLYQTDNVVLMDWIYYHEVVSEFSLRHWAEAGSINSFCKGPLAIRPKEIAIASKITCPMDVLDLIRIICKRPYASDNEVLYDDIEIEHMWELQHNIQKTVGVIGPLRDSSEASLTRSEMLTYLYRCTALIYFNRAVADVSTSSFQHRRLVREGILLLQYLGCCESAWPLFILACEANEDERRLQILNSLSESERESPLRSNHVPLIRTMVEAIWNQNDLNLDSNVGYVRTLYAIISTAPWLPLFA